MTSVELRVLVQTSDPREQAAERIEAEVRRRLAHWFPEGQLYVDRVRR